MEHTREEEREMILNPFKWPHLILPLKRFQPGKGLETAILSYPKMRTIDKNEAITIRTNTTIFGPLAKERTTVTYKDVEALLDDGWVVD
jgi:hypothetical protein